MKPLCIIILIISAFHTSNVQEMYTSRIGSKFFPGHLDIIITIDSSNLNYELFNHWYTQSYVQLRQIKIPLDSLQYFNQKSDSIWLHPTDQKVHLNDVAFNIDKNVKRRKSCAELKIMRNISYAYKISFEYDSVRHFDLYDMETLNLEEAEFKKKATENLEIILKN